ncbi:hypothetical protein GPALN_005644 [Globodera pallida]|nr:hypothetical protein GPALN_005644 [Globodera pallida]
MKDARNDVSIAIHPLIWATATFVDDTCPAGHGQMPKDDHRSPVQLVPPPSSSPSLNLPVSIPLGEELVLRFIFSPYNSPSRSQPSRLKLFNLYWFWNFAAGIASRVSPRGGTERNDVKGLQAEAKVTDDGRRRRRHAFGRKKLVDNVRQKSSVRPSKSTTIGGRRRRQNFGANGFCWTMAQIK